MIPKVRTWRVRLWNLLGREIGCVDVPAINRRFALWNARDVLGWGPGRVSIMARCRGCGGYHVGGCSERVRLAVADRWAP